MDENNDLVIIDSIDTIKHSTNRYITELKNEILDLTNNLENKSLKSKQMNENILQLIENQNYIISNLEKEIIIISQSNKNLLRSNKFFKEKLDNFEKVLKIKKKDDEINYDPSFYKKKKM